MTAFVTPNIFVGGVAADVPTTTEMEKYRTNLTHFSETPPPPSFACVRSHPVADDQMWFGFIHGRQYLVYASREDDAQPILQALHTPEGDPDDTEDDKIVNLPATEYNTATFFDLSQIPWLVPGMPYQIYDVWYAFEVDL